MRLTIVPPRKVIGTMVGLFALLVATLPSVAQQSTAPPKKPAQPTAPQQRPAQQPTADSDHELVTYFYKDPRPERLNGFLQRFQVSPVGEQWGAYPPVAGFLAAICMAHPDKFTQLIPADLKPKMATSVGAAMRLCGNEQVAVALKLVLERVPFDDELKTTFTGLPTRLSDLRITHPTHLDIFWGASFAAGSSRYVAPILEYFAQTANQSEAVAVDVAQVVVELMGGPKGTLAQLRGKYGTDGAVRMAYAATALWALQSNARQHAFVDQYIRKYMADNPGNPATKALTAMMPRGSRT
jgi:hypothetical protein